MSDLTFQDSGDFAEPDDVMSGGEASDDEDDNDDDNSFTPEDRYESL